MAMRKSSRNYIHKKFDELLPEPNRIEGFVPIIPKRKEFVGDLQKIIEANEGSSRANSKSCWVPFDEDYKSHRCELSDALRAETERELGGYFQPMSGKDLALELLVFLPEKSRRMNRLNDIIQTLVEAMHFNAWTTDNKQLGLFASNAVVWWMPLMRVQSLREGDPEGIHYAIYHRDPTPVLELLAAHRDDPLCVFHGEGLVGADSNGIEPITKPVVQMSIEKEIALMSACMADEHTPLHPAVLNYFQALRSRYSTDTARRLAVFEQSRLDVAIMFDGEPEEIIAGIDERTKRLLETDEKGVSVSFCIDNH